MLFKIIIIIVYPYRKSQFRTIIQTSKHTRTRKVQGEYKKLKHPCPPKKAQWAHGWIHEIIILCSIDLSIQKVLVSFDHRLIHCGCSPSIQWRAGFSSSFSRDLDCLSYASIWLLSSSYIPDSNHTMPYSMQIPAIHKPLGERLSPRTQLHKLLILMLLCTREQTNLMSLNLPVRRMN